MAHVRGVVRRDAADVHPGRAVGRGHVAKAAGGAVEDSHGGSPDALGKGGRADDAVGSGPRMHAVEPIDRSSERRPRDRGPAASRHRERRTRRSRSHRRATASTSRTVSRSSSASRRSEPSPSSTDSTPSSSSAASRSPGPAPEHGAQLVLAVEADPVVDAVAVAAGHRQHVAALAVGVVGDDVEDGHPSQRRGVLVDQHHRLVVRPARVEDVQEAGRQRPLRYDVHRVRSRPPSRLLGLHPQLHHAWSGGTVTQHRRGHDVPAEVVGDHPCGVLPGREGAVGEVPQRPLPRARLVDALDAGVARAGSGRCGSRRA